MKSPNGLRLSLRSASGVADPRDMKWGTSCPRQKVQQIPGCPILRVFCEGWDTTNLDTDRRISHPLPRAQRMGHPPIRGASCRAQHQPRLKRELVSSQLGGVNERNPASSTGNPGGWGTRWFAALTAVINTAFVASDALRPFSPARDGQDAAPC